MHNVPSAIHEKRPAYVMYVLCPINHCDPDLLDNDSHIVKLTSWLILRIFWVWSGPILILMLLPELIFVAYATHGVGLVFLS